MSIASEFEGLPMEDLIGAPLLAAVSAQGKMAMQTAGFIQDVGVNSQTGELNTVGFSYKKAATAEDGTTTMEDKTIIVPLLSIVNIPSLKVKLVEIDFEMEVKQQSQTKSEVSTEVTVDASYSSSFSPFSAKITAKVAGKRENTRSTDNSAKYSVKVIAEDDGMPEGLSRVLTMLSNIIVETNEKPDTE